VANDTDIWVAGLAIAEMGWLGSKVSCIERKVNVEYVHKDGAIPISNDEKPCFFAVPQSFCCMPLDSVYSFRF
jgi:hypothetical protein